MFFFNLISINYKILNKLFIFNNKTISNDKILSIVLVYCKILFILLFLFFFCGNH